MGAAFVETLPVGKFHGVGPVTADKMKRLGILTGADLRGQSLEFLQQHFGKSGTLVPRHRQWRGQSSGRAGPPTQILGIGNDLCRRPDRSGSDRGRRAGDGGRCLGLVREDAGLRPHSDRKIKYADFRQVTRSRTLPAIITSQESLRNVSIGLVRTVFPPANGIRLLGVTLSSLESADRSASEQLDLGLVGP